MRITNPTILRGYNRDLNRLLNLKTQSERRITSGRSFSRASESPLSAATALNVRKSLYYSAQYKDNLKTASKFYTEAETSLLQVSTKMAQIRETIIAACNTTKDTQEYNIYAQQLETSARELCAIFNTDSAERSIFGGESDNPMPFEILDDSSGAASTVLYHGVPVNAMNDYTKFPYSKEVNIDIGIGMQIDQETQEVDPQSVLCISFNGAETSGCGAERGVADVDLSSMKENRIYCVDVYAGNIKKTIAFCAKDNYEDTVNVINGALKEAFKKEVDDGKVKQPVMDAQGVISVEDGICCVVNNDTQKRINRLTVMKDDGTVATEKIDRPNIAEKLVVDNDSGYTNKFKVNLDNLKEGEVYSISVKVGDREPVDVLFKAGEDADIEKRNAMTLDNIQKALDEALPGEPKVNISRSSATKGIISAEGAAVKVTANDGSINSGSPEKPEINSTETAKYNINSFEKDVVYSFKFPGIPTERTVMISGNEDFYEKFNAVFGGNYGMSSEGVITKSDGSPATGVVCKNMKTGDIVPSSNRVDYTINAANMTEGKEYGIKVVFGNTTKEIAFKAGADVNETKENLQKALNNAFLPGNIMVDVDGDNLKFNGSNNNEVSIAQRITPETDAIVERERVYSNNYIQLTLDAARALRHGDIEYANGCIDRIVSANEHLLVEIADLGCNEEFIDFNLERITTREENLSERQNDLEAVDAKREITLWKTYEAMYNACLQMSSSVVPNSIFNYIN